MPRRAPTPLQTTLLSGEMASVNLEEIRKRYKFKEISVATWRDPRSSTLPARGGPSSPSVSAGAVARPFVPTYKVSYKLPEPTDDEASEEEEHDDASAVDTEEDQIVPVDSPLQEPMLSDPVGKVDKLLQDLSDDIAVLDDDVEDGPIEDHVDAIEDNPEPDDVDTIIDLPADQTSDKAPSLTGLEPQDVEGGQDVIEGHIALDTSKNIVECVDQGNVGDDGHIHAEEDHVVLHQGPEASASFEPLADELPPQAIDLPISESPIVSDDHSLPVSNETEVDVPFEEVSTTVEPADSEERSVHFAPGTPEPRPTARKKKSSKLTKHKSKKKTALSIDEYPDDIVATVDGSHADDVPPPVPMPPGEDNADVVNVTPMAGDKGDDVEQLLNRQEAAPSVPEAPIDKPILESAPSVRHEKKGSSKLSKEKAKKKSSKRKSKAVTEPVAGVGIAISGPEITTGPPAEQIKSSPTHVAEKNATIDQSDVLAGDALLEHPVKDGSMAVVADPIPATSARSPGDDLTRAASEGTAIQDLDDVGLEHAISDARSTTGSTADDCLAPDGAGAEVLVAQAIEVPDTSVDEDDQLVQEDPAGDFEVRPLEPANNATAPEQDGNDARGEAEENPVVRTLEPAGDQTIQMPEEEVHEAAIETCLIEPTEVATETRATDEEVFVAADETAEAPLREPAMTETDASPSENDGDPADGKDEEPDDVDGSATSADESTEARANIDGDLVESKNSAADDSEARAGGEGYHHAYEAAATDTDAMEANEVGEAIDVVTEPEGIDESAVVEAENASTNAMPEEAFAPVPEMPAAGEENNKGEDQSSEPTLSRQECAPDDAAVDDPSGTAEVFPGQTETCPDVSIEAAQADDGVEEPDSTEVDQGVSSEQDAALIESALDAERSAEEGAEPAAVAVHAGELPEPDNFELAASRDEGLATAEKGDEVIESEHHTEEGEGNSANHPTEGANGESAAKSDGTEAGETKEEAGPDHAADDAVPAANENVVPDSEGPASLEMEPAVETPGGEHAVGTPAERAAALTETVPPLPAPAQASPKSSQKHTDHWARRPGRGETSKRKSAPDKRPSRRSKDMTRSSDDARAQKSKKYPLTAEEEADRQKRRGERFAREKARIEEEEQRKADEEELRRIRHEARRAARKAAAEEAARLARQEAERIAREDAEARRRRREARERAERERDEREHAKSRSRSSRKRRDSVIRAPLLFRTSTGISDRRRDDESVRRSKHSDRHSLRRSPSPKKAASVREVAEELETSSPVVHDGGDNLQPSSHGSGPRYHRSRRYTGEEPERPRSSRKEDGHRSRKTPVEDKPKGFFASLIRRF